MKVVSMFDGISCGMAALYKLGIDVQQYYAFEVDKYASAISAWRWSDIQQLGDVCDWRSHAEKFKDVDLILAGFPCQPHSMSGNRKGLNDPRGQLIYHMFDIIDFIREHNPKVKFLLENVTGMKQDTRDLIYERVGVHPVTINSSIFSAQNRNRLYWTNITIPKLPEDKGIVLQDILEDGYTNREKSYCIDANYFKGGNLQQYFEKHRRQLVFSKDGLCHIGSADLKGNDSIKRVYHPAGKGPTLTTMGGGHREPKILYKDGWRKLTPLECERLQTLPNQYTGVGNFNGIIKKISNTQRYRCIGNGWTVDAVAHILSGLL